MTDVAVRVLLDSPAKPVTTAARVSIVTKAVADQHEWPFDGIAATHQPAGDRYRSIAPGSLSPGKYLLVVRLSKRAPVAQRFEIDKSGLKPGWGFNDRAFAASVSPTKTGSSAGSAGNTPQVTLLEVTLFAEQHVLLMAGKDFPRKLPGDKEGQETGHDPLWFRAAEDRPRFLRISPLLEPSVDVPVSDGAIVITYDLSRLFRSIRVKAQPASDPNAWLEVERLPLGHAPPFPRRPPGIITFYIEIAKIGAESPKTLIEASLFGHAFLAGPILIDTFDRTSSLTDRDHDDRDGRLKDWLAAPPGEDDLEVYPGLMHEDMKKAFAEKSTFRVWGCNPMDIFFALRPARTQTSRNTVFSANLPVRMRSTAEHTRANLLEYFFSRQLRRHGVRGTSSRSFAYCAAAARVLTTTTVIGTAPGFEGSQTLRRINGDQRALMFVPLAASSSPTNAGCWTYYWHEFNGQNQHSGGVQPPFPQLVDGLQFTSLGYLDFTKSIADLKRKRSVRWVTERCLRYGEKIEENERGPFVFYRLPSYFEAYGPTRGDKSVSFNLFPPPSARLIGDTVLTSSSATGGTAGHLYRLGKVKPVRLEFRQHLVTALPSPPGASRPFEFCHFLLYVERDSAEELALFAGADGKTTLCARTTPTGTFTRRVAAIPFFKMRLVAEHASQRVWEPAEELASHAGGVLEHVDTSTFHW